MADTTVVVGGNVAALAAADALARDGSPVELYVPARGLGAGFAPLRVEGRQLPLGFRVLELVVDPDHPRRPPPLERYTQGVANHRDWLGLLDDWFAELVGDQLRPLAPPDMVFGGRWGGDVHYSLDAWPLAAALTGAQRAVIAAETAGAVGAEGAAGVLADPTSPLLWDIDVETASRTNHGPTLHDLLVDAVCRKIREGGAEGVPAALRRKVWMPVFWPQTVLDVAEGREPSWRPTHRRFHDWGARDGVTALLDRLAICGVVPRIVGAIESVRTVAGRTRLGFADGVAVETRRPILGVSATELFASVGATYRPDQLTSVLCWIEVPEADLLRDPSVVMVADRDVPAFRISAGGSTPIPGTRLLTVELAHDVPEPDAAATATSVLERIGLVRPGAAMHVVAAHRGLAFTDPTFESRRRWAAAHEAWVAAEIDARVLGGAGCYAADSLNEQVVQGLWAATMARLDAPVVAA